jgi:DNA-binding HxlR family transcriptional regulator
MQPKATRTAECPAARALECVGEWWSLLILRDAFQGFARFDQFRKSLGIAPNILSRRLAHLTEAGLFEKRLYSEKPARHEYVLTQKGRDFFPVVVALFAWGNQHLAPEGPSLLLAANETEQAFDPVVVDRISGAPITLQNSHLIAGPQASAPMRARLDLVQFLRAAASDADSRTPTYKE